MGSDRFFKPALQTIVQVEICMHHWLAAAAQEGLAPEAVVVVEVAVEVTVATAQMAAAVGAAVDVLAVK